MTNHELLHGKRITNVYDGRPDDSVLIRLDDRTDILIRSGAIMREEESWPLGIDAGAAPDPEFRVTSLCGCAWEARVDPDALLKTTAQVDLVCPTHGKVGVRLELTSPVNADLLEACKAVASLLSLDKDENCLLPSACRRLEAAIAKAENRSYIGGPKPDGNTARGKSADDVWVDGP